MDRFDFSPLFRSSIGFDRLARMVDAATRVDNTALSYPPYNIEKTGDDAYRLTMAVAGFGRDELDLTVHENTLIVTGKAHKEEENNLVREIPEAMKPRQIAIAGGEPTRPQVAEQKTPANEQEPQNVTVSEQQAA